MHSCNLSKDIWKIRIVWLGIAARQESKQFSKPLYILRLSQYKNQNTVIYMNNRNKNAIYFKKGEFSHMLSSEYIP